MARTQNTTELVREIREQCDEENLAAKSDEAILRVMNRGLRFITSQLARSWEDPLIVRSDYNPADYDATTGFLIPDDAFEQRITLVQVGTPGSPTPIPFRSYSDVSSLQLTNARSFIPMAVYTQAGGLFLAPRPGNGYPIIIHYVRRPDNFVLPIGRINTVDQANNYVVLDDIDLTQVSTNIADRLAFVNVVDGRTGYIKGSLQVQRIDGTKVSFRTTVSRETVEGRPISTEFDATVEADDYICPIVGTCVLQNGEMFSTYIVQYAAGEIARSLGDTQEAIGQDIQKRAQLAAQQQRAGRPSTLRVKNRSGVWGRRSIIGYPVQTI